MANRKIKKYNLSLLLNADKEYGAFFFTFVLSMICHLIFATIIIFASDFKPKPMPIMSVINISMVTLPNKDGNEPGSGKKEKEPEKIKEKEEPKDTKEIKKEEPKEEPKKEVKEVKKEKPIEKPKEEIKEVKKEKPKEEVKKEKPIEKPVDPNKEQFIKDVAKKEIPKKEQIDKSDKSDKSSKINKTDNKTDKVDKSKSDKSENKIGENEKKSVSDVIAKMKAKAKKDDVSSLGRGDGVGTGVGSGGKGRGRGTSGLSGGAMLEPIKAYLVEIAFQVEKNWAFSDQLIKDEKNLEVLIVFRVLPSGEIEDIWFEKKSGNNYFDDSAYKAIKKSNPVYPHPKGINIAFVEVPLRFTPSGLR